VINLADRTNYVFESFNGYTSSTHQAYITLDKMFPILPSAGIVSSRDEVPAPRPVRFVGLARPAAGKATRPEKGIDLQMRNQDSNAVRSGVFSLAASATLR